MRIFLSIYVCLLILTLDLMPILEGRIRRNNRNKRISVACRPRVMMRYKMTVHTLWNRRTFPKMYPTYRPPAQWSVLIGSSHNSYRPMWREGQNATLGVKTLAKSGDPTALIQETSPGHGPGILDSFAAPAIDRGSGHTSTTVFLDGRHIQISFMMKLIPSPDWFIGLSGLNLCRRGRWRRTVHINLRPLDAGTDQGMTFTAPNWPNDPVEPISSITSTFPDHEADSFYYPDLKVLPRIAYVDLELMSEYRLRRTISELNPPKKSTLGPIPTNTPTVAKNPETTTRKPIPMSREDGGLNSPLDETDMKSNKEHARGRESNTTHSSASSNLTAGHPQDQTGSGSKRTTSVSPSIDTHPSVRGPTPISTRQRSRSDSLVPSVTEPPDDVSLDTLRQPQFLEVSPRKEQDDEMLSPPDCVVTSWSEWSACSQTCGFGKQERTRDVVRHSRDDGSPCPRLQQEVLCGSMRKCKWNHFSFLGATKDSKREPKRGMRRRRRKHQRNR